jgi:hypothetical protein
MANKGRTQIGKIARWKLLEARLRERLAELPALAADHDELQRTIVEAEELEATFQFHRGAWQEAHAKRTAIATAGETLRSRIALALQYQLGPKSKQLVEFGLRPRPGRPSQKKDTPEEPAGGTPGPAPEPAKHAAEGGEAPPEAA